ncbi:hypothetical protein ADIS_4757 [Lunatimonas lonarensis]|uniref:Uncharacterized protein n=2 Tax=Lunatimonas lonarensis TaxID=1232681 RepID=R7ZL07_9BACT|nr:hypothetical protein ADIS_4757 [Lunatimonas lonarensis]
MRWLAVLYLGMQGSYAQTLDWQLLGSISNKVVDRLSTDKNSYVFIADREGNITQFSALGDSLNFYSPAIRSRLTILEAEWTVNLFLFSADLQQFEFLDRFLRPLTTIGNLSKHGFGVIKQATLGNGNVLWLIDENRLSLIRWDFRRQAILQEQPFSTVLEGDYHQITGLAERKNLLFLHSKGKGVFIFDNQGNPITQLREIPDVDLYFSDDYIYYIHAGEIHRVSYVANLKESTPLPKTTYKKIVVSSKSVLLATDNGVDIYALHPGW